MVRRRFARGRSARRAAQHGTSHVFGYTSNGTIAAGGWFTHFVVQAPSCRVYEACLNVNTAQERREVHFTGRVQGVGFRFTTRAIAGRHPVRGIVKNLSDGRVLVVVEGTPETLDGFLADLEAELSHYIVDKDVAVLPATHEFSNFDVRR